MSESQTIRLHNDLAEIVRLTGLVEDFCDRHQVPPPDAYRLNLALDETITNVVNYGFPTPGDHEIIVILRFGDGMLSAEVIDNGVPFDPLQRQDPDVTLPVEERPIGGLGVYFVKQMMDKAEYRHDGERNHLFFGRRVGGNREAADGGEKGD